MCKSIFYILIFSIKFINFVENSENVTTHMIEGNDYPYMAAIFKKDKNTFICAGTIVRLNWILTTAHCVKNYLAKELYIRVGTSRTDSGGETINVITVVKHENYNRVTAEKDFAMISVGNRMKRSSTVAPLEMPTVRYKLPLPGAFIRVLGWSLAQKRNNKENSLKLRELELAIIDSTSCQHKYRYFWRKVKDSMFCLEGSFLHEGACYGDSGGPAVYNEKIIGVITWVKDCFLKDYPLVLQRVDLVQPWIDDVIDKYTYNFNL